MNPPPLTPREIEVMELLAKGYLVKEIAQAHGVSFWTIAAQIRMIYAKMGARSRSQAIIKWLHRADQTCPFCHQVIPRAEPPKKQELTP